MIEKIDINKIHSGTIEIMSDDGLSTIGMKSGTEESLKILAEKVNEIIDSLPPKEVKSECPPHDMQPYQHRGAWGASVPPPTRQCTKCLITS